MKPYGLPRHDDVAHPDCGDLSAYALKSSKGHSKQKGGDFKNTVRSSNVKRQTRRLFKKAERLRCKQSLMAELH